MDIKEITVEANTDRLYDVLGFLEEQLEAYGAGMKLVNIMSISLEEMFANVCMYAYAEADAPGTCTIKIWKDETNSVNVSLIDNGMYFDPLKKDDPNIHATAEERGIGGLGIYMVKGYMDECTYERINEQNIFTMRKVIS